MEILKKKLILFNNEKTRRRRFFSSKITMKYWEKARRTHFEIAELKFIFSILCKQKGWKLLRNATSTPSP